MLLADLLAHLARRFPDGATVLSAEITLSGPDYPAGLIETVSYETDDGSGGGPDGGEEVDNHPRAHLRLVA